MNKAILGISGLILLACGFWYFFDYISGADAVEQEPAPQSDVSGQSSQNHKPKKPPLESNIDQGPVKQNPDEGKSEIAIDDEPADDAIPEAVAGLIAQAELHKSNGDILAARNAYSAAFKEIVVLNDLEFKDRDAALANLRTSLKTLNDKIYFDTGNLYGDQAFYKIRPGDSMQNIARAHGIPMERLAAMNGIADINKIVAGKTLKIVNGAFHVVIDLSDCKLYVLHGEGGHYFCEYRISIGKSGSSTPVDNYTVFDKQHKPHWTNPDTMEVYAWGDPQYPLGTRWIKLLGDKYGDRGIGIHGQSGPAEGMAMGQAVSHGCIRMHNADVEALYGLLSSKKSRVTIKE